MFPYGQICEPIEVVEGGLMARSGIKIPEMGDKSDEFGHRRCRHNHRHRPAPRKLSVPVCMYRNILLRLVVSLR